MNKGYTQANRKADMAAKMVTKYKMNGVPTGKAGGMKYLENGKDSGKGKGMGFKEYGPGIESTKGMKSKQSNAKANFSNNYKQNGIEN